MDAQLDASSLGLLEDGLRKTMLSASGAELDAALAELGWAEMLSDMPELAVPLVFRLLGETGSHASVLNDVVLHTLGLELGGLPPLPYAGGGWVVWDRQDAGPAHSALGGLPLRRVDDGQQVRLAEARHALGWWLVGSARAMLTLARRHALDRVQFGKAAAGKAALTAAKHCQQVLGGIGFTEEHDLHRHVKRALVLDGLLGSSRELTRKAGAGLRARGSAPRLAQL